MTAESDSHTEAEGEMESVRVKAGERSGRVTER